MSNKHKVDLERLVTVILHIVARNASSPPEALRYPLRELLRDVLAEAALEGHEQAAELARIAMRHNN
jgi:hypothetical protein